MNLAAGTAALLCCATWQANAISLEIGSYQSDEAGKSGGLLSVKGSTLSFLPSSDGSGFSFTILDGIDSVGLNGHMSGAWTIGSPISAGPNAWYASVSGLGTLSIVDDDDLAFTADLSFQDIKSNGSAENLNVSGQVNLGNFHYTGANADLLALTSAGAGIETVTFQFGTGLSLPQITDGTEHKTSFSGSITSVPDVGSTLSLLGMAMVATGGVRRFIRRR